MNTPVEAVILSGGLSQRMGTDKSKLLVHGEPMVTRLSRLFSEKGIPVTILGPDGVPDQKPGQGPLVALSGFTPRSSFVFVCSCDIPRFDARLVDLMLGRIEEADAVMPTIEGREQPLCALYRDASFGSLRSLVESGERKIFAWVSSLRIRTFDAAILRENGLDPLCTLGANTPEAWATLVDEFTE